MWAIALTLNILHVAYHQLTTNFDFFPFNNIRHYTMKQRIAEVSVNFITMGFPVLSLLLDNHTMIGIACWFLGFLLCGEFLSWWKAYLFGGSEKWKNIYNKIHKDTITILPPIKDNPIPNLEHCILHVLTLATFVVTIIYYSR
jgi:hypothetical protein